MVNEYKGDLLKSGCDMVCHQVNLQGVMGGGLAQQIANKYPTVEENYKDYARNYATLGNVLYDYSYDDVIIVNMFSQTFEGYTNYSALNYCITDLLAKIDSLNSVKPGKIKTVGIPKYYGCGIAIGNWDVVRNIWLEAFENRGDLELQIWEWDGD